MMKKWTLFLSLYFCLCLLTACGAAPQPQESPFSDSTAPAVTSANSQEDPPAPGRAGPPQPSLADDEEPTYFLCRIIDGAEDGNLLLAELGDGLYGGSGVYRLSVSEDGPCPQIFLDCEPATPSVLEDGMTVEIGCSGGVLETFPAQLAEVYTVRAYSIGTEQNPGGSCYDLCGLYLQVLDDLWQKDSALNEDITQLALDLSQAPGDLTESERAALVWRFGELHGIEAFPATFDELLASGVITAEPLGEDAPAGAAFYHWEDGCLFSIRASSGHEGESYSLSTLFFDAEKWRSSLGAYCFHNCSAMWPQAGTWNGYSIGSEMIS